MVNARARPWTAGRSLELALLAAMWAIGGVLCLLAAQFPIDHNAPVGLLRVLGAVRLLVGLGLFLAGPRLSRGGMHVAIAALVLGGGLLISRAHTTGGQLMVAWSFQWIAVYVALFFSPRTARAYALLITVACVTGIALAGVRGAVAVAVLVSVTVWAAAIALSALSERLREQADTDPLTGLLNRSGFTKAADREHALAGRTGAPLAIAVLDLDGFKRVNDMHGHAAGDRLLAELARTWGATLRPGDVLARIGGDEFLVMLPATSLEDAGAALTRLHEAHAAAWSAGVAQWQRDETLADCLLRADGLLYDEKARKSEPGPPLSAAVLVSAR